MDPLRLTLDELSGLLGIDAKRVLAWIGDGLPWHQPPPAKGKRPLKRFNRDTCWFDEEQVAEWLEASGLAGDKPPNLVKTIVEVAKHCGVSKETIGTWINVQGAPGKSEWGFYDCDAIAAWHEERAVRTGKGSEAHDSRAKHEAERSRIRKEKEQLELDQLRGTLIDVAQPLTWIERLVAELRTRLEQIPEVAFAAIPSNVRGAWKQELRKKIEKYVDESYEMFATAIIAWEAELEEPPEQDDTTDLRRDKRGNNDQE